jgi:hypothetical protein
MNNRIAKDSFISRDLKPRDFPNGFPDFPHVIDRGIVRAKCPKCGRITSIRVCYGCKELMCEECLIEHQIGCLHKKGIEYGRR